METDQPNITVEPRLIYNLESGQISFDPPVPLPMGKRLGRAFDEMMDAIGKFREAMCVQYDKSTPEPTTRVPAKLFDRIVCALAAATYPNNPDRDRYNANNLWTELLALRSAEEASMRNDKARSRTTEDHLGRDAKDFAIEFGEYLAQAAELFIAAVDLGHLNVNGETFPDHLRALNSAIYEFRKRVAR